MKDINPTRAAVIAAVISAAALMLSAACALADIPSVHTGSSGGHGALVCIDPGHGGADPGAIANDLLEKDLNLDIALQVRGLLEAMGYQVLMTRETDVYVSLEERCRMANLAGAAVFVSIHNNAAASPAAEGTETFCYYASWEGRKLAGAIHDQVMQRIDRRDRGVKEAGFYVLRNTNMPAALFEGAFLTNEGDAEFLSDPDSIRKMAEGVSAGINDYLVQVKPRTLDTWYLAEGSSAWGFDTYVTIQNPNPEPVTIRITYMTRAGARDRPDIVMAAMSQAVVNPRSDLGVEDFSTRVECLEGKPIAVDRRMIWAGAGAPSPDGHASIGVISPERNWYLPEGSSAHGFECWLLVQNPNDSEAVCAITYMIEGEGPRSFEKRVAANSRASFSMAEDIGARDASIRVSSNFPVIAERAMYRNNRRSGHASVGATSPALDFFLAEGAVGYQSRFVTYVLVQNPNSTDADVALSYYTGDGEVEGPSFTMRPNTRRTIRVNDQLPPDTDVSIRVRGSRPIIAERAMYWGTGSPAGEACHASVGTASAHTTFYLPDGETYGDHETWTLVANPNDTPVEIELTYMVPGGVGNLVVIDTVPARSRSTFSMAEFIPEGKAAVMVKSRTFGKSIVAERAMYWNDRGAGTNTIGGWSD